MNAFFLIYNKFFLFFFCCVVKLIFSQINDNFDLKILEEGNYELLDVTDYHNLNLIVSTSKNIYTGIPPSLKIQTSANLIKATSLITISENYLLAACLEDAFLGRIKLSDGEFTCLLTYSEIVIDPELEAPTKICSLTNIDHTFYIGYTRIIDETKVKNILFKIEISNPESDNAIDSSNINIFEFPESTDIMSSSRQISCVPLQISSSSEYRLTCLFEDTTTYSFDETINTYYNIFAVAMNSDFNNFEGILRGQYIKTSFEELSFKIYLESDNTAKCISSTDIIDIKLLNDPSFFILSSTPPTGITSFNGEKDLFSYNEKFIFSVGKTSFMGKEDIYSFKIVYDIQLNYFELYDYQDTLISKILGYYNNDEKKVILIFQTSNNIKYFIIDFIEDIFNFNNYKKTYQLSSFEEITCDLLNEATFDSDIPNIINYGYLNVESITYYLDEEGYSTDYFGLDFYDILMSENVLIPLASLNNWKNYSLSFVDHVENEYTRFYHLRYFNINIETCENGCLTCWEGYNYCTNCSLEYYAELSDHPGECYDPTDLIQKYIINEASNIFEPCFNSCEYCSISSLSSSTSATQHNCIKCLYDYLPSFNYPGNCYLYPNLQETEEKEVINGINFISSTCANYKIATTGECIAQCPSTSPYYTYEYNETTESYDKVYFIPKYSFNKICYEQCPENTSPNSNNECICDFYYYKDTEGNKFCYLENKCSEDYPYLNLDTLECIDSLENCNYFFENTCYENCPSGKIDLASQSNEVKNYIKEKLSLGENLVDKFCICDTTNSVWSNINNEDKQYYQECLASCPEGYIPEEITKQCILNELSSESTIKLNELSSESTITLNELSSESTIISNELSSELTIVHTTQLMQSSTDSDVNCPTKYENRCYQNCPKGTCLTQDDIDLKTCVKANSNTKVFNDICFEDFDEITKNIKYMSQNDESITTNSGIIIHGYSTNSNFENKRKNNTKYSFVNLGDCEYKIKLYYNLSNETELYILGIDSPNKDESSSVNVYNYGVYLENGTLLDHVKACKELKISISSLITNSELVKLDDAVYFSNYGYDIYDENSTFYKDNCASASINGNDITLSDRKKDFYPNNISLCNDSCYYSQVDLDNQIFTCECELNYNFTSQKSNQNNEEKEEEDVSYIDYFLSLINYKIFKCHKLFLEYKSYYYNAGFYIAVGTFFICFILMFVFIKCGINSIKIEVLNNIPNKAKIFKRIKNNRNCPPKNKNINLAEQNHKKKEKKGKNQKNIMNLKLQFNIINEKKTKAKGKKHILKKKARKKIIFNTSNTNHQNSKDKLNIINTNNINKDYIKVSGFNKANNQIQNKIIKNMEIQEEEFNVKELNSIPYSQALRIDKRNYGQIFLSVFFNEIKIISIFYYKHPYEHLSIILSQYILELCLDLTLNCILYTEDVISEKYNNNGSIKFFTSLSLSFISNIISSIIAYILSKIEEHVELFESIINNVVDKSSYLLNILKFRKILTIKLFFFFLIQTLINIGMCYYLMIFCAVYHKTQVSIMINYIIGVAESLAISLGLTIITSILRTISLKCRIKSIYYTSKYFFEKF